MTAEALTFPDAATRARLRTSAVPPFRSHGTAPGHGGNPASDQLAARPTGRPSLCEDFAGRMACGQSDTTPLPLLASDPVIRLSEATGGQGEALRCIAAKRAEQHALGYTPEHDLQGPIGLLANVANRYLQDARDWLHRPGRDPGRRHYRLKLVNAAALIAAEIDRLDHELEQTDA